MHPEKDWDMVRNDRGALFGTGTGVVGVALLFSSAAIALALIAAPIAESYVQPQFAGLEGLDRTVTGSTGRPSAYTIRKSVLQPSPDSVCIIRANGLRSGEC
jgi:hypothetical protein